MRLNLNTLFGLGSFFKVDSNNSEDELYPSESFKISFAVGRGKHCFGLWWLVVGRGNHCFGLWWLVVGRGNLVLACGGSW